MAAKKDKSLSGKLRSYLIPGFLIATAVLAIYVLYLDQKVQMAFAGTHWAVPARVFARPLEVYQGQTLPPEQLEFELKAANYYPVIEPKRGGQYRRVGNTFEILTRGFTFYDAEEASQFIRIDLQRGRVNSLVDIGTGKSQTLVRFDPAVIGRFFPAHNEDRELVKLGDLPPILVAGLIATEDRHFYEHNGVDFKAIARAFMVNMKAGRIVQGGSTLTQQLVKNFYLSNRRSFIRKGNEAIMSLLLERHASKDEILEAYLNEVYLGQDGKRAIHGVGLGSQFYFGSEVADLTLHQLALLIGIVNGPSYYDPRRHPERARQRRNHVLNAFAATGMASEEEVARAILSDLDVIPKPKGSSGNFPAYIDLVKRQLKQDYDEKALSSEGLRIFTSFDPYVQHQAEVAIAATLSSIEAERNLADLQGALVVARADQGGIVAVVGDRNPKYNGFNRALDAYRQIGSIVKPVVYSAALDHDTSLNLASPLQDVPLDEIDPQGNIWTPQNYDKQFHGEVPLYLALAKSYNVPTVRLGLAVGYEKVVRHIRKMGIDRDIPAYMASLLGVNELSPLEVTQIYHTMASGGFVTPLSAITEVLTAHNEPLKRYPIQVRRAANEKSIFQVNYAMHLATRFGTGRALPAFLPDNLRVAGKTGTTDDLKDAWFAGFSGDYVGAVWVGKDDNSSVNLTGATGALPVFGRLFGAIAQTSVKFDTMADVQWHRVSRETGGLVDQSCAGTDELPFFDDNKPYYRADCYGRTTTEQRPEKNWLERIFE